MIAKMMITVDHINIYNALLMAKDKAPKPAVERSMFCFRSIITTIMETQLFFLHMVIK